MNLLSPTVLLLVWTLSNAQVANGKVTQLRPKKIQVELDPYRGHALVAYDDSPKTETQVVYARSKRLVAYKDGESGLCLLERVATHDVHSEERGRYSRVYQSFTPLQKDREVEKLAGKRIATFCHGSQVVLMTSGRTDRVKRDSRNPSRKLIEELANAVVELNPGRGRKRKAVDGPATDHSHPRPSYPLRGYPSGQPADIDYHARIRNDLHTIAHPIDITSRVTVTTGSAASPNDSINVHHSSTSGNLHRFSSPAHDIHYQPSSSSWNRAQPPQLPPSSTDKTQSHYPPSAKPHHPSSNHGHYPPSPGAEHHPTPYHAPSTDKTWLTPAHYPPSSTSNTRSGQGYYPPSSATSTRSGQAYYPPSSASKTHSGRYPPSSTQSGPPHYPTSSSSKTQPGQVYYPPSSTSKTQGHYPPSSTSKTHGHYPPSSTGNTQSGQVYYPPSSVSKVQSGHAVSHAHYPPSSTAKTQSSQGQYPSSSGSNAESGHGYYPPSSTSKTQPGPTHYQPSSAGNTHPDPTHYAPSSSSKTQPVQVYYLPSSTSKTQPGPTHYPPSSSSKTQPGPTHYQQPSAGSNQPGPTHYQPPSAGNTQPGPTNYAPSSSSKTLPLQGYYPPSSTSKTQGHYPPSSNSNTQSGKAYYPPSSSSKTQPGQAYYPPSSTSKTQSGPTHYLPSSTGHTQSGSAYYPPPSGSKTQPGQAYYTPSSGPKPHSTSYYPSSSPANTAFHRHHSLPMWQRYPTPGHHHNGHYAPSAHRGSHPAGHAHPSSPHHRGTLYSTTKEVDAIYAPRYPPSSAPKPYDATASPTDSHPTPSPGTTHHPQYHSHPGYPPSSASKQHPQFQPSHRVPTTSPGHPHHYPGGTPGTHPPSRGDLPYYGPSPAGQSEPDPSSTGKQHQHGSTRTNFDSPSGHDRPRPHGQLEIVSTVTVTPRPHHFTNGTLPRYAPQYPSMSPDNQSLPPQHSQSSSSPCTARSTYTITTKTRNGVPVQGESPDSSRGKAPCQRTPEPSPQAELLQGVRASSMRSHRPFSKLQAENATTSSSGESRGREDTLEDESMEKQAEEEAKLPEEEEVEVKEGDVLEPGDRILGKDGYTILDGYRGRVVAVTGHVGKTVNGSGSSYGQFKYSSELGRYVKEDGGKSYSSCSGELSFACTEFLGSNGRAKICKPNPRRKPDGSPC